MTKIGEMNKQFGRLIAVDEKTGRETYATTKYWGDMYFDVEQQVLNGKLDGTYYAWHEGTNQLHKKCTYKDGKLDGIEYQYGWDGHIIYETPYKNGLLDGVGKEYDQGGSHRLKRETVYQNGTQISSREIKPQPAQNAWTFRRRQGGR